MPACTIPEGLRRINGVLPFKQKWHGCGTSKNYLHNQPTPLLVSQACESCRDSSCCLVCYILLRVVLVLFAATLTFRFRSRSLLRPRAAYVALYCFCPPASPSISVVLYRKIIPRIVCFVFAAIPACRCHSGQPSSSTRFSCSLVAPFLQNDSSTWATVVPHQNVTHARRFRNQTMKRTAKAIVKTTQIMAITSLRGIVLWVKCEVDDTGLCKVRLVLELV
jgi:hypothetical protein